jgi:hypothetical protein
MYDIHMPVLAMPTAPASIHDCESDTTQFYLAALHLAALPHASEAIRRRLRLPLRALVDAHARRMLASSRSDIYGVLALVAVARLCVCGARRAPTALLTRACSPFWPCDTLSEDPRPRPAENPILFPDDGMLEYSTDLRGRFLMRCARRHAYNIGIYDSFRQLRHLAEQARPEWRSARDGWQSPQQQALHHAVLVSRLARCPLTRRAE